MWNRRESWEVEVGNKVMRDNHAHFFPLLAHASGFSFHAALEVVDQAGFPPRTAIFFLARLRKGTWNSYNRD